MATVTLREYKQLGPDAAPIPQEPAIASQNITVSTSSVGPGDGTYTALNDDTRYIGISTDGDVYVNYNGDAHASNGTSEPVYGSTKVFRGIAKGSTLRFIATS